MDEQSLLKLPAEEVQEVGNIKKNNRPPSSKTNEKSVAKKVTKKSVKMVDTESSVDQTTEKEEKASTASRKRSQNRTIKKAVDKPEPVIADAAESESVPTPASPGVASKAQKGRVTRPKPHSRKSSKDVADPSDSELKAGTVIDIADSVAEDVDPLPAKEEQDGKVIAVEPSEAEAKSRSKPRNSRSRQKNTRNKKTKPEVVSTELADELILADKSVAEPVADIVEPELTESPTGAAAKSNKKTKSVKKSGAKTEDTQPRNKRKMFVSILPGEQVEVVITEEGTVQEYYVEMLHQAKVKGNIYKGIIHNVDPNLQAAFVSYGAAKNGFLQIDEVHPEYYLSPHEAGKGHKYPLMQKVLKAGQEILVQVVKEPSGSKGAFLTSYLSIPGRFLVLTPGREQIGVSRKLESEEERSRLRELLSGLTPGPGLGVIVRTVSMGASKTSLQRDLQFLKRVWRDVRKKGATEEAPQLIYQELGLAARAVRDYLTDEITELWVDDESVSEQLKEVVSQLFPRRTTMVQLHNEQSQTLFERFSLRKQLEQVQSREVVLPSGGRLVFDHTEALTAIDINSGRSGGKNNFEDMAYKLNMEAAQAIPLQLRLRDIGGQVVVDFIEMRDRNHWREVERAFRNGMKGDRARHDVGKISSFGLLEVVRQRLGSSAISISNEACPFCGGTGQRRNLEWQSLQALRDIQRLLRQNHEPGQHVVYSNNAELILYLLNNKKERLIDMEKTAGVRLELRPA